MVTEISPTYYAAGFESRRTFELIGTRFERVPDDAVAVMASSNDMQLEHIGEQRYHLVLEEKSRDRMVFASTSGASMVAVYIGAILSSDLQEVYWLNETNPLP